MKIYFTGDACNPQGEVIDRIESNVVNAQDYVETATEQLGQAQKLQTAARKVSDCGSYDFFSLKLIFKIAFNLAVLTVEKNLDNYHCHPNYLVYWTRHLLYRLRGQGDRQSAAGAAFILQQYSQKSLSMF